jgi:hypothetical protein
VRLPEPVRVLEAETLDEGVAEGGRLPDGDRDGEGVPLKLGLPLCVPLAEGVRVPLTLMEGVAELVEICMPAHEAGESQRNGETRG